MKTEKQRETRRRKRLSEQRRREKFLQHVSAEPGTTKPIMTTASVASEPVAEVEKDSLIVEAAADGESVKIKLYGGIGGFSGVGASEFSDALEEAGTKDVTLHINSGGGSVFAAVAIYNMLAALKQRVTVVVEGVAASAATLIAMAGDEIKMAENAFWMVHKARGSIYGTADDMRNYIELLDKANNSLLLTYAARTGITREELETITSKDTWMSAAEAMSGGWIDAVIEAKKVKPHVAPKSEAVTAEKYDAEHYREFIEQVDTLAASVGVQKTIAPAAVAGPPTKEAHAMKKRFSEWLLENSFDAAVQTELQLKALRIAWRAECGADAVDDVQAKAKVAVSDGDEAEAARYERRALIDEHLADFPKLAAQAIRERWDEGRMKAEANLATIRQRPQGPAIHGGDGDALTQEVYECSLLQSYGSPVAKEYSEPVQDLAHKRFRSRVGIQQMLLANAHANGYDNRVNKIDDSNLRSVLQSCIGPAASGGFSTLGTTGILGNTAKKSLKAMFENLDQTWRRIASTGSTNDFKLVTRYRLLGHMEYKELGKGGEIEHAGLAEESHTEKLKTVARMFALTREDIINDDLGAFDAIPRAMARGASFRLNTDFWTEFLDNGSFFTTARGNKASSAGELASDTLTTAVQEFLEQTITGHGDDTGTHFLGLMPKILLVPPAVTNVADELYMSPQIMYVGDTDAARLPTVNIHAGRYQVVTSPYLGTASNLTNASDTGWYLLADPM